MCGITVGWSISQKEVLLCKTIPLKPIRLLLYKENKSAERVLAAESIKIDEVFKASFELLKEFGIFFSFTRISAQLTFLTSKIDPLNYKTTVMNARSTKVML